MRKAAIDRSFFLPTFQDQHDAGGYSQTMLPSCRSCLWRHSSLGRVKRLMAAGAPPES